MSLTNKQKLRKITDKAQANGYHFWNNGKCGKCDGYIFDHKFAKAFFGEDDTHSKEGYIMPFSCDGDCYGRCHFDGKAWQYHIQQLALTPDDERIDYLYDHI